MKNREMLKKKPVSTILSHKEHETIKTELKLCCMLCNDMLW